MSHNAKLGVSGVSLAILVAGCNLIAGLDAPEYDPSLDTVGSSGDSSVAVDGSDSSEGGIASDSGDSDGSAVSGIDVSKLSLEAIAGMPGGPGYIDGPGASARFWSPQAIATSLDFTDPARYLPADVAYVLDSGNHAVRRVSLESGAVTTLSRDGELGSPELRAITYVKALDLVVVTSRHALIGIDASGKQRVLAGERDKPGYVNGLGGVARFTNPWALASNGVDTVWVADNNNCAVRQVVLNAASTVVSTFSGGVCKTGALLTNVNGLAYDLTNRQLYASANDIAYQFDATSNPVQIAAGVGNLASLAVATDGTLFNTVPFTHVVRATGKAASFAGRDGTPGFADGKPGQGLLNQPTGIARGKQKDLFVVDSLNHSIRKVDPDGNLTKAAGFVGPSRAGNVDGAVGTSLLDHPQGVAFDSKGLVATIDESAQVKVVSLSNLTTSTAAIPPPFKISGVQAIARDEAGVLYAANSNLATIIAFPDGGGTPSIVAGQQDNPGLPGEVGADVDATSAQFDHPAGLAFDKAHGLLYISDFGNGVIRKFNTATRKVTTLPGKFASPAGVAFDTAGNIYVSEFTSHTVKRIGVDGNITLVAGTPNVSGFASGGGSDVRFTNPQGLAHDGVRYLYVADSGNHMIRAIDTASSAFMVTDLIGDAQAAGFIAGPRATARLNRPGWITLATDASKNTTAILGSDPDENVVFRIKGF